MRVTDLLYFLKFNFLIFNLLSNINLSYILIGYMMPYSVNLILLTLPICRDEYELWLVQVPLHCFNIIDMHCPYRDNAIIWCISAHTRLC